MYNNNMMEIKFKYIVSKKCKDMSIEEYFKNLCLGKEKSNSLIFGRKVEINDEVINDKRFLVKCGDEVVITVHAPNINFYNFNIDILYEDDNVLVVNKPQKILVHPDGNQESTLLNAVYYYLEKERKIQYAYPIHRIDFDTTGIVIFAKDPLTLSFLCAEIEKHNMIKEYVCLCHGNFESSTGKIKSRIGKNRHCKEQVISYCGKDSETIYKVEKNDYISKVRVQIIHGRRHQIRVHMKSIGHPIVGDKIYGFEDGENLKLHFKKVTFYHPFKNKKITIQCKEDF